MHGVELLIQRMTDYDFSGLAVSGTSNEVLLAEVDGTQYREGTLEVLLSGSGYAMATGAAISVNVYAIARSEATPDDLFKGESALATVTLDQSKSGPRLILGALSSEPGGALGVFLKATRSTHNGNITATIETRLSLKR